MEKYKNKFENFFQNNKENIINKWDHYFDIYERHFSKYNFFSLSLIKYKNIVNANNIDGTNTFFIAKVPLRYKLSSDKATPIFMIINT